MGLRRSIGWSAAAALTLLGCGGGGGDSPAAPPATPLTVSGTAAAGRAIAGATVDVRCATGNGAGTTGTDGTYSVSIAGGAGPCTVRVASSTTTLHGLAIGTGSSLRANVTPVTELVVARLAGATPADFFVAFGASSAATATASAAQAAASGVVAQLRAGGVDFSAVGDVVAGPLLAARSGVSGDAHDQRLDALAAALSAGQTTLTDLTQAILRASPSRPVSARSAAASLPPDRLLQAPAADCSTMRSGRYRLVRSISGAQASTEVITIDAPALRYADASGTVTLAANGDCTYTGPSGGQLAVSRAGVAIARVSRGNGLFGVGVGFAEQDFHVVADLAGEWATIAFERTPGNGTVHATASEITLDATGRSSDVTFCDDVSNCVTRSGTAATSITVTANAGGGFDLADATRGTSARLFAYRAGGGELMAVTVTTDGLLAVWGRRTQTVLPALGRTSTAANLFVGADYAVATAINASQNTVASIDTAARTLVRNAVTNFATGVTRPETLGYDVPRVAFARRSAGNVIQSNGVPSTVAEFTSLNPVGMEFSALILPTTNQFGLSVAVRVTP